MTIDTPNFPVELLQFPSMGSPLIASILGQLLGQVSLPLQIPKPPSCCGSFSEVLAGGIQETYPPFTEGQTAQETKNNDDCGEKSSPVENQTIVPFIKPNQRWYPSETFQAQGDSDEKTQDQVYKLFRIRRREPRIRPDSWIPQETSDNGKKILSATIDWLNIFVFVNLWVRQVVLVYCRNEKYHATFLERKITTKWINDSGCTNRKRGSWISHHLKSGISRSTSAIRGFASHKSEYVFAKTEEALSGKSTFKRTWQFAWTKKNLKE